MSVFGGIAACFHTVKMFSNFELNYVRLIGPFKAKCYNACFAFTHDCFTTLERSTDIVRQCNGNFFMMKTVFAKIIIVTCRRMRRNVTRRQVK